MFSRWIQGKGEEKVHVWVVRVLDGLCLFIAGGGAATLSFSQRLEANRAAV